MSVALHCSVRWVHIFSWMKALQILPDNILLRPAGFSICQKWDPNATFTLMVVDTALLISASLNGPPKHGLSVSVNLGEVLVKTGSSLTCNQHICLTWTLG